MKLVSGLLVVMFSLLAVRKSSAVVESIEKEDIKAWENFKIAHNKNYESEAEELRRRDIFLENKRWVEAFNANEDSESYKVALNYFSDLSKSEIREGRISGMSSSEQQQRFNNSREADDFLQDIFQRARSKDISTRVDWTKVPGRVSHVKDQRGFGASWAFAAAGVLEGQMRERTREQRIVDLSAQNLIDCTRLGDDRRRFEAVRNALDQVRNEGGIMDEYAYRYDARQGQCRFNRDRAAFRIRDSAVLPRGDEEALKQVVFEYGPVAVMVDGSEDGFRHYRGGVYHGRDCRADDANLRHALLIVGYNTNGRGDDWWLLKNSWGNNWGEGGYIKIARNRNNMCGIASMPVIPTF